MEPAIPDSYITAEGINNNGEIVGDWENSSGVTEGYTYSNGTFTNTGISDSPLFTNLYGVNDSGVISGYNFSNGVHTGFILSGALSRRLPTPGRLRQSCRGLTIVARWWAIISVVGRSGVLSITAELTRRLHTRDRVRPNCSGSIITAKSSGIIPAIPGIAHSPIRRFSRFPRRTGIRSLRSTLPRRSRARGFCLVSEFRRFALPP